MGEDYVSAAIRHTSDAEFLLGRGRVDNAGYLAGYGVECSLKAVVRLGGGLLPKALGHNLENLHGAALELATLLSPGIRRYRVEDGPRVSFLIHYWDPELRYERSGSMTVDQARSLVREARTRVRHIVHPMILDGLAGVSS